MHISTYVYLFTLPIDNYVRIIYNIDTVKEVRNTGKKKDKKSDKLEIVRVVIEAVLAIAALITAIGSLFK